MGNLEAIYTDVDDLYIREKHLIETGVTQRRRPSKLSTSEVMTIVIAFYRSGYCDFK
ncbi:hypothetical protein R3X26_18420 [Vibrio sp. TH_r3]|uniref:hypothetical protein n=1 Tax=Vibrio sp. TH_r3 TaxID=3082084 RepID=UPI0029535CE2|nr:hypothetical protein [Vibrio sp. TH_r3]MDV7106362.1 hypothetical protein [Vibrio sp. TH_r3]